MRLKINSIQVHDLPDTSKSAPKQLKIHYSYSSLSTHWLKSDKEFLSWDDELIIKFNRNDFTDREMTIEIHGRAFLASKILYSGLISSISTYFTLQNKEPVKVSLPLLDPSNLQEPIMLIFTGTLLDIVLDDIKDDTIGGSKDDQVTSQKIHDSNLQQQIVKTPRLSITPKATEVEQFLREHGGEYYEEDDEGDGESLAGTLSLVGSVALKETPSKKDPSQDNSYPTNIQIERIALFKPGDTIWEEYVTENGQPYYYNTTTGESVWQKPAEFTPKKQPNTPRESSKSDPNKLNSKKNDNENDHNQQLQEEILSLQNQFHEMSKSHEKEMTDVNQRHDATLHELQTQLDAVKLEYDKRLEDEIHRIEDEFVAHAEELNHDHEKALEDVINKMKSESTIQLLRLQSEHQMEIGSLSATPSMKSANSTDVILKIQRAVQSMEKVEAAWEEHQDDEGRTFYYNPVTEESVWEMPLNVVTMKDPVEEVIVLELKKLMDVVRVEQNESNVALIQEKDKLKLELSQVKDELSSYQTKAMGTDQLIEVLNNDLEILEQRNVQLQQELKQLIEINQKPTETVNDLDDTKVQLPVDNLTDSMSMQLDRDQLQLLLTSAEKRIKHLEYTSSSQMDKIQKMKLKHAADLSKLKESTSSVSMEGGLDSTSMVEINELKKHLEILKSRNNELEEALQDAKNEIIATKKENESIQMNQETLLKQISSLQMDLKEITLKSESKESNDGNEKGAVIGGGGSNTDNIHKIKLKHGAEVNKLKDQINKLQNELTSNRQLISKMETDTKLLNEELKRGEDRVEEMKNELKLGEELVEILKNEKDSSNKELENLQLQLPKLNSASVDSTAATSPNGNQVQKLKLKHSVEVGKFKDQINQLQSEYQVNETRWKNERDEYKAAYDKLQLKCEELNQTQDLKKKDVQSDDHVQQLVLKHSEEMGKLQELVIQNERQLQENQSNFENDRGKLQILTEKLNISQVQLLQAESKLVEKDGLLQKHGQQLKLILGRNIHPFKKEVLNLRKETANELNLISKDCMTLSKTIERSININQVLQMKLEAMDEEIKKLQDLHSEKAKDHEISVQKLQKAMEDMKSNHEEKSEFQIKYEAKVDELKRLQELHLEKGTEFENLIQELHRNFEKEKENMKNNYEEKLNIFRKESENGKESQDVMMKAVHDDEVKQLKAIWEKEKLEIKLDMTRNLELERKGLKVLQEKHDFIIRTKESLENQMMANQCDLMKSIEYCKVNDQKWLEWNEKNVNDLHIFYQNELDDHDKSSKLKLELEKQENQRNWMELKVKHSKEKNKLGLEIVELQTTVEALKQEKNQLLNEVKRFNDKQDINISKAVQTDPIIPLDMMNRSTEDSSDSYNKMLKSHENDLRSLGDVIDSLKSKILDAELKIQNKPIYSSDENPMSGKKKSIADFTTSVWDRRKAANKRNNSMSMLPPLPRNHSINSQEDLEGSPLSIISKPSNQLVSNNSERTAVSTAPRKLSKEVINETTRSESKTTNEKDPKEPLVLTPTFKNTVADDFHDNTLKREPISRASFASEESQSTKKSFRSKGEEEKDRIKEQSKELAEQAVALLRRRSWSAPPAVFKKEAEGFDMNVLNEKNRIRSIDKSNDTTVKNESDPGFTLSLIYDIPHSFIGSPREGFNNIASRMANNREARTEQDDFSSSSPVQEVDDVFIDTTPYSLNMHDLDESKPIRSEERSVQSKNLTQTEGTPVIEFGDRNQLSPMSIESSFDYRRQRNAQGMGELDSVNYGAFSPYKEMQQAMLNSGISFLSLEIDPEDDEDLKKKVVESGKPLRIATRGSSLGQSRRTGTINSAGASSADLNSLNNNDFTPSNHGLNSVVLVDEEELNHRISHLTASVALVDGDDITNANPTDVVEQFRERIRNRKAANPTSRHQNENMLGVSANAKMKTFPRRNVNSANALSPHDIDANSKMEDVLVSSDDQLEKNETTMFDDGEESANDEKDMRMQSLRQSGNPFVKKGSRSKSRNSVGSVTSVRSTLPNLLLLDEDEENKNIDTIISNYEKQGTFIHPASGKDNYRGPLSARKQKKQIPSPKFQTKEVMKVSPAVEVKNGNQRRNGILYQDVKNIVEPMKKDDNLSPKVNLLQQGMKMDSLKLYEEQIQEIEIQEQQHIEKEALRNKTVDEKQLPSLSTKINTMTSVMEIPPEYNRKIILDLTNPSQCKYFYFPLELTKKDYIRRIFDIMGDGIRGRVLHIFQMLKLILKSNSQGVKTDPIERNSISPNNSVSRGSGYKSQRSNSPGSNRMYPRLDKSRTHDTTPREQTSCEIQLIPTKLDFFDTKSLLKIVIAQDVTDYFSRQMVYKQLAKILHVENIQNLIDCASALLKYYDAISQTKFDSSKLSDLHSFLDSTRSVIISFGLVTTTDVPNGSQFTGQESQSMNNSLLQMDQIEYDQIINHQLLYRQHLDSVTKSPTHKDRSPKVSPIVTTFRTTSHGEHQTVHPISSPLHMDALLALKLLREIDDQMKLHKIFKEQRMEALGWCWDDALQPSHDQSAPSPMSSHFEDKPSASLPQLPKELEVAILNPNLLNAVSPTLVSYKKSLMNNNQSQNLSNYFRKNNGRESGDHDEVAVEEGDDEDDDEGFKIDRSFTDALGDHIINMSTKSTTHDRSFHEGVGTTIPSLADVEELIHRSEALQAHLSVCLIPKNIALIELMIRLKSVREFLVGFKTYNKSLGRQEEVIYLRTFIKAVDHQLHLEFDHEPNRQKKGVGSHKGVDSVHTSMEMKDTDHHQLKKPLGPGQGWYRNRFSLSEFNQVYEELDHDRLKQTVQMGSTSLGGSPSSPIPIGYEYESNPVGDGMAFMDHAQYLVDQSVDLITQIERAHELILVRRNSIVEQYQVATPQTSNVLEQLKGLVIHLTELKESMALKLTPFPSQQLSRSEELNSLLLNKGTMIFVANTLYNLPLGNVNQSVATLLIRIQSIPLLQSIYHTWPNLQVSIPMPNQMNRLQNPANVMTPRSNKDIQSVKFYEEHDGKVSSPAKYSIHTPLLNQVSGSLTPNPRYPLDPTASSSTPYSNQFIRSNFQHASPRLDPHSSSMSPAGWIQASPGRFSGSLTASYSSNHEGLTIPSAFYSQKIIVQLSKEVDLFTFHDFHETKSLRTIGFTLLQLRDAKVFKLNQLLSAGYPLIDLKCLRDTATINVKDLRTAGYTVEQCSSLGFDAASLLAGGFNDFDLVESGVYSSQQLKQAGCDIQRFSLMSLYDETDGRHWKNNQNWGTSRPLSEWYGIWVDKMGQVIKIDLRNNELCGKLPEALSLLTSLQCLDLYNNQLMGTIPESFQKLQQLKDIWLSNNHITVNRTYFQTKLPQCKLRI